MNKLSERSVAAFRARLVAWYARNKRAMPWRGTRDAYCVWVSEIMLQQTRVAAVEPYYQRFLRRFPTVRALARARNEEVLKHWAGLGYYSRARNLHRAAREIVAKHDGRFPREVEAALALPGVGRYTAAAVLSIAYGEPLAVVDGNVARVVARLEAVRGELKAAGRWKRLEKRAQELMGAEKTKIEKRSRSFGTKNGKAIEQRKEKFENRNSSTERRERNNRSQRDAGATQPGEWNQAMMELGATVCTPRAGSVPWRGGARPTSRGLRSNSPRRRRSEQSSESRLRRRCWSIRADGRCW
ncbi:MAG: A/G-specific adenine glycosylase [Acidobacteria bacterium]|nr:A/G-specific adenine glycosylase [Acidobacteriota bacterium]